MSISYRFIIDESYCQERYARESEQRKWYFRLVTKNILMLVLAVVACLEMLLLEGGSKYIPVIIAVAALTLIANFLWEKLRKGPTFLQKALLRQNRKDPDFDVVTSVTFSDIGLNESGPVSEKTADWKSFKNSVRFPDGILLPLAGHVLWLPDASLQESTSRDATEFVAARTDLRHRE